MQEKDFCITICPSCQSRYRVSCQRIGEKVTCRKCGNRFEVATGSAVPHYPIIGKLAVRNRLISVRQLDEAISIQQTRAQAGNKTPIEKILIDRAVLSSAQLDFLRSEMRYRQERAIGKKFGLIAIKNGFASKENVERALQIQAEEFRKTQHVPPIGDLLVESGAISEQQRDVIRVKQQHLDKSTHRFDKKVSEKKETAGCDTKNDGPFVLTVSDDRMEAYIQFAGPAPAPVSIETLKDFLKANDITYGIASDSAIKQFLEHGGVQEEKFKIAEGTPPKPGKGASIHYHFDTEYLRVGAIGSGGHIDFKERGEVPQVKKGDLLAEKIPAEKGEPGIDVYGNSVPAAGANDIELRCGMGAQLSEDFLKIFAQGDGQPKISFEGKISVLPELKIAGDIGLETGHVVFDGNIAVSGIIQSGFRVEGNDVSAMEILGAEIKAAGDVHVAGGIIGAKLDTRGSVTAKFIKGAKVSGYGNIIVEKEIIDSDILISGACRVPEGKIISSVIAARRGIEAADVGTSVSDPCKLKVGVEDHIRRELKGIKNAIGRRKEGLEELNARSRLLEREDQELHKKITVLAQVQDRAIIKQRTLRKEMIDFEKKGENDRFAETRHECEKLDHAAKKAGAEISELFEKQDQQSTHMDDVQKNIKSVEKEIGALEDEKMAILEWSHREKRFPVLRTSGSIYGGTRISGIHSSITLKETISKSILREVKTNNHEWEMRVVA